MKPLIIGLVLATLVLAGIFLLKWASKQVEHMNEVISEFLVEGGDDDGGKE
ncbi:hypothetical protein [Pyrococcus kukulkanii]|uniref:hypothetical protein n=1 Tax=Pyrococcus kukulkanii TaxID=1609559 RepID=UPI00356547EF